jgi:steroid delta-isomerase-like uncharacterized protein
MTNPIETGFRPVNPNFWSACNLRDFHQSVSRRPIRPYSAFSRAAQRDFDWSHGMTDNKAVIQSFFDKLNARDFDGAAGLMTVDCVHHTVGLGGGDRVGREEWLGMAKGLWASFPDRAIKIHQIIGEGSRVAARLTWSGTQKGQFAQIAPTGRPVEVNGVSVFAMKDGKITEQWMEQDILAMYQQLGAAPGHSDNWPKL